jgi:hypothetical protein
MSARAPAAREKKSSGSVAEATINPTHVLEAVNSNMSHAPAADWMKVPAAEKTLPAHNHRKWGYRSGPAAEVMPAE